MLCRLHCIVYLKTHVSIMPCRRILYAKAWELELFLVYYAL